MKDRLPDRSPHLFKWFVRYAKRYLRRHFHAVRLAQGGPPQLPADESVLIYFNHHAWWDPLVALALSDLFPDRRHYGVAENAGIGQYKFLEKLGFFGIDTDTWSGAATFLRLGQAILECRDTALWMTPEGDFTDLRKRPVVFQPGMAHLVRRLDRGWVLPLALEYQFWNERTAEVLCKFGPPVDLSRQPRHSVQDWNQLLTGRLESTMDELAELAMTRDEHHFETWLRGKVGVGGVYDLWRRARAWATGQRFDASHGQEGSA